MSMSVFTNMTRVSVCSYESVYSGFIRAAAGNQVMRGRFVSCETKRSRRRQKGSRALVITVCKVITASSLKKTICKVQTQFPEKLGHHVKCK